MSDVLCPASLPKPARGIWRRCPCCGATGTRNRQVNYGIPREYEHVTCAKCNGAGWLAAPWYYDLPISQWPEDARGL